MSEVEEQWQTPDCSHAGYDPDCYLPRAEQETWLGVTSLISVVAYLFLIWFFRTHHLMQGSLGNLLLAFTSTFFIFNATCVFEWVGAVNWVWPIEGPAEFCQFICWLDLFAMFAGPLYFVALTNHMKHLASNPFKSADTLQKHIGVFMIACLCATYESPIMSMEAKIILAKSTKQKDGCPNLFLYSWNTYWFGRFFYGAGILQLILAACDLQAALGKDSKFFSDRKRLILKSFMWVLVINVVQQLTIPNIVMYFKTIRHDECMTVISECFMQGVGAAVPALAWLVVYERFSDRLAIASDDDDKELNIGLRAEVVERLKNGIKAATKDDFTTGDMDFENNRRKVDEYVTARAPKVFHELRKMFNISKTEYKASMNGVLAESVTEGKSGAFMYFTEDRRFIIKTATKEEFDFLLTTGLLKSYYDHCDQNRKTLINPIVGAFELMIYNHHSRIIIVQSVFWLGPQKCIFQPDDRYDLKGSWVGRSTKPPASRGLPFMHPKQKSDAKRDMDIHEPLLLKSGNLDKLADQLKKDSNWLRDNNIMDYSLLLGVKYKQVDAERDESETLSHQYAANVSGPTQYCFGIIDVLQIYSFRKRAEYHFLTKLLCKGPGVSCVPPRVYAQRFQTNIVDGLIRGIRPVVDKKKKKTKKAGDSAPTPLEEKLLL